MLFKLKCIVVLSLILIWSGAALSKSLYVISDINSEPTPISAYSIQGNQIVFQFTQDVPYYGIGAVGIALDANSKVLFITYEGSSTIQILDATTMEDLGTVEAEGSSNLAGIVFDNDKNLLYVVDRGTPNLYAYQWDADSKTLTLKEGFPIQLSEAQFLYGIALDEVHDILYVADASIDEDGNVTGGVRYYSTSDWSYLGSFQPSLVATDDEGNVFNVPPISVAVDYVRGFVYTAAGYLWSKTLSQYNINTGDERTVEMDQGGIGISVDQETGLIYMTNGNAWDDYDFISVWDPVTLTQLFTTGDLDGDPTGIVVPVSEVSYNPLALTVADSPDPVSAGQNLIYTICFSNENNSFPVHNVTLVDDLPDAVSFVSATGGGTYDDGSHTVTWSVGTLEAGEGERCLDLVVSVVGGGGNTSTITNSVTIDSDDTPPTTVAEDTTVMLSGDLPDLSDVRVLGPRVWRVGMRSVVLVRYKNTGSADVVGSYKVSLYLDDQKLSEATVVGRPRKRRAKILVFRINSAPDAVGSHTLRVVVDDGDSIQELDEGNNEGRKTVTIRSLRRRRIRR